MGNSAVCNTRKVIQEKYIVRAPLRMKPGVVTCQLNPSPTGLPGIYYYSCFCVPVNPVIYAH